MLVYLLIPELRDLHGKTLVCYVLCLTIAYIFLAAVQLVGETLNQKLCVICGEYPLIIFFVDKLVSSHPDRTDF
jgi:hypothetical protein